MRLNTEELFIGFFVGLAFIFKVGLWAVPIACLTSFLWAYTGAGASKLYRRLGVPLAISSACALIAHSFVPLISVPLGFAVLSIGYGIPSTQPPDEGSWLGQLCYDYADHDEKKAEIYCRSAIYVLLAITFLPCLVTK